MLFHSNAFVHSMGMCFRNWENKPPLKTPCLSRVSKERYHGRGRKEVAEIILQDTQIFE